MHNVICDHCLLPVAERDAVYDALSHGTKGLLLPCLPGNLPDDPDEGLEEFYKKRDWRSSGYLMSFVNQGQ